MSEEKNLRAMILLEGARGNIEEDAAHTMLSCMSGAPILKPIQSNDDKALGKNSIYETLDTEGNVLVAGENYLLYDEKVKVLREEHFAGNMLDVNKRIFYLNSSLEENAVAISGKYPNGIFSGAVYNSSFQPIKKNEEKK